MAFGSFVLTDFGHSILVKAHAGKEIHFSRMALGDGDIGTSSVFDVKALKSEKLSLLIDAVSVTDADATVTVLLQSSAVDTGFNLKEMGLMVTDPDTSQESVYAYNRDTSAGEYVPDKNSSSKLSEYLRVHCNVEGATNITFNSSGNPLWITRDELTSEVSSQIDAKAGVAGGLALYDTLKAFMDSAGAAGGLALYDTLKTFMDSKGQAGGLASYDNSVQSATIGGTAVTKSGTALQFPAYPTSLPANGGNAATLVGITPGYRSDNKGYIPVVGSNNAPLEIGAYIDFHQQGSTSDFDCRIELKGDGGGIAVSPPTNLNSPGLRNIVYHATPSTGYLGDGVLELIPKS